MTRSRAGSGALLALVIPLALINGARAEVSVEQFGESLAQALQAGEPDRFTDAIDRDTLIDRALAGMQGNEGFAAGLRKGLERGLSQVGTIMVGTLGPAARVSYVRVRTVEGVPRVLVRIDLGERGLNYLDFFVHRRSDDSWAVYDWIDFVQGQAYTESLRMVMALMVRDNPGMMSRLLGLPEVDRKLTEQIAEMGRLGQQGDWTGWLRTYRTLPDDIRRSRVLLTTRIAAAGATGDDDEYMKAMADLHAHHGDDPTLSLALVDYHLLEGDHPRAYEAVDRLDEYTGGDAALTNLRSGIALHQGDNAASIRFALQAISDDPEYENPYWNLVVAGARAGNYRAAMQGVRALETRFGYEFSEEEMMASGEFSGLLASEEWRSGQ